MSAARAKLLPVLAALCLVAVPSWGCLNSFDSQIQVWRDLGDTASIENTVKQLQKAHAEKPTLENSNDLGVVYLLTGRMDEAIALLRATEKKFPGSARVAANLGTALELAGKNEEALEWIRQGVLRDVNEHHGSEWLHARALQARLALADNPDWFDKNSVLGLDFGTDEVPVAPEILPFEKGRLKGAEELLRQIDWQLLERTRFVKPPDAIVGDLYASAGDLVIASGLSDIDGGREFADGYYDKALAYGAPHEKRIRARLARYKADVAALPPRPTSEEEILEYPTAAETLESSRSTFWYFAAAAMVLAVAGFVAFRIRRRRMSAGS